ncbi:hypothetical protein H4F50_20935 [Pectobacterium brasiliense]|uniref:hypothetical protein n=1 Tax=Pectobacterium TaxID=122277 RepID=UPI0015DE34C8|nr:MULTISPECIES: hypothetical protein [Pectobacterium]MBA0190116.1 hypothetical protein [Pectobacterium odoriferum]MBN3104311.1 hypothetical protein [Pectobacterium brasiliense]
MNNSSGEESVVVDFTVNELKSITLFTGRKNGKKAKSILGIKNSEYFVFIGNPDQVITSSYFLGLVGEELSNLFKKLGTVNYLLDRVDLNGVNEVSRNECVRAIKRGIFPSDFSL